MQFTDQANYGDKQPIVTTRLQFTMSQGEQNENQESRSNPAFSLGSSDVSEQPLGGNILMRSRNRKRTEEEKKRDRIMANRRSARESRERKKKLIEHLEARVRRLDNQNSKLRNENEALRKQLALMMVLNGQIPRRPSVTTPSLAAGGIPNVPLVKGNNTLHHPNSLLQQTLALMSDQELAAMVAGQQMNPAMPRFGGAHM